MHGSNMQADAMFAGPPAGGGSASSSPFRILRRHIKLVAAIAFGVIALIGAYVVFATPVYTAEATLQVASDELTAEDSAATGPAKPEDEQRINTQLELLNSLPLARLVVKRLDLTDDPEFQPSHRSLRRLLGLLPPPHPVDADDARAVREAGVVDGLSQRVTIARVGTTHLISITAKTHDARKSMRIANAFMELHIERIRREKEQAQARAIAALEAQVEDLRRQATAGERATASYGRSQALVGTPGQAADPAAMDFLTNQLATARTGRAEAAARLDQFTSATGAAAGQSGANSTPLLNELRVQQATVEKRLVELEAQFGPAYPEVASTRAQRDELATRVADERRRIDRGLAADVRVASAREGQLSSEAASVRSQALRARDAGVGFGDLQSGAQTLRAQYVTRLIRLQEMRGRQSNLALDASVAARALLPTVPSDPKPLRLLAVAVIAGLLLGGIAAMAVEQTEDRVRTSDDIRQVLGVRTLAMVPELSDDDAREPVHRLIAANPTSVFGETARSLYLALVPNPGDAAKCIMVTSALPAEGKTTVAASLATAATMMGNPAIVVDLDFRRPALSRSLQLGQRQFDLVDYLEGRATLDDIIVVDQQAHGLAIVTINRSPADPGRYASVALIAPLIAALSDRYQLVVVDAPPVLPVSDARAMASLADATLLVTRWRKTSKVALRVAGELLSGRVTAAVLNRVDYKRHAADAFNDQLQYYGSYASYFGPSIVVPRGRPARVRAWIKRMLRPGSRAPAGSNFL